MMEQLFTTFEQHIAHRMAIGAREYAGDSYRRPVDDLMVEMLEEAADLAAWGDIALAGCPDAEVTAAIRCAQNLARQAWERLQRARALESVRGTEI